MVIGANRACAAETVGTLLAGAVAGALPPPGGTSQAFRRLVRSRSRHVVDARGPAAIDRAELAPGREDGRPRVKFGTVTELVAASKGGRPRLPG